MWNTGPVWNMSAAVLFCLGLFRFRLLSGRSRRSPNTERRLSVRETGEQETNGNHNPQNLIQSHNPDSVTEEPYLIIGFSSGLGGCERVFVPVLIRIYATGPGFAVASCIAHYRYLPRGCKLKHETNSELCAAKCAQEISQARKLGCVRGVNLRLSQPEATIGCRKDAIFSGGAFGLQGRKRNMTAGRYFMWFH